jgi:succinate dehydrogenase flavin-adding protein (antitoxin of CptAB toxin-antitoxin module)
MKELDLLLESWVRHRFDLAATGERLRFEALLRLPDPDLVGYLLGGQAPPAELAPAIEAVLANAGIMSRRDSAEPSSEASL